MPRDLVAATETAAQASKGTAHAYLAELYFDSTVTESRIEWESSPPGNADSIAVEVSTNGGRSWVAATNGGEIPGLEAGTASHGKTLIARQFLLGGLPNAAGETYPAASLDWIEVQVDFDTGEQILRTETSAADLALGTLIGVEVDAVGQVKPKASIGLGFTGTVGSYVRVPGGIDSPINLSRGLGASYDGVVIEESLTRPDPLAVADERAFTVEVAFAIDDAIPKQTLLRWYAYTRNLPGFHVYVENGRFCCNLNSYYFSGNPRGIGADDFVIESPVVLLGLAGQIVNAAVVYDGVIATLWVNGQAMASRRTNLATAMMSGDLFIGAALNGQEPFNGTLHELRLWKGAVTHGQLIQRGRRFLSDDEVTAYYSDGDPREETGLRAYYRCDDGAGSTLTDAAGSNDGTLVQSAAAEAGVRWVVTPPQEGEYTLGDIFAPYRDSPTLDLATYGNRVNVCTTPFNISYADVEYLGVGELGSISQIEETAELESRGLTLTLSGVQLAHVSIALQTTYRDRPCRVLMAIFGDDGLLKGEPVVLFEGLMDTMPVSIGDSGNEAVVSVTCESNLVRWEEARPRRWTSTSQRELYPDDAGLDLLQSTAERTIWWPAKFTPEGKDAV